MPKVRYKSHILFMLILTTVSLLLVVIPYDIILLLNSGIVITSQELQEIQDNNYGIIDSEVMQLTAYDEDADNKINEYSVKFKLFNLFNITNLKVKVVNSQEVYAGGSTVGIHLQSKGVVVVGSNYIITKDGNISPFNNSGLNVGDVILKLNDVVIGGVNDIVNELSAYNSNEVVKLKVLRKGKEMAVDIYPALDVQTGQHKLGLWIRDDAMGVGTLTFIDEETKRFGALGHAIVDSDTKVKFDISDGQIYPCNVVGIKQGKKGVPGELMGLFMRGANTLGSVDKNSDNGIYGYINNEEYISQLQKYEIGGRLTARPGKAKILTCINGVDVKEYDIEIIKTNYQSSANEKSMVLKVTDSELIDKTGGIVQGMSGSPIIQDGKIVGAVTHVFVNDPQKGFGLYLDWMLVE